MMEATAFWLVLAGKERAQAAVDLTVVHRRKSKSQAQECAQMTATHNPGDRYYIAEVREYFEATAINHILLQTEEAP